jgi:predicted DCC family thiol-disulfide oxidoreductase YuxK
MSEVCDVIFYDGDCGLCHRWVKFVLPRDSPGSDSNRVPRFLFSPLGSEYFRGRVDEMQRETLPDSIVLLTANGQLLTRSSAVIGILRRLGGVWALLAGLMAVLPRGLRDWGYDRVAAVRHRFFAKPTESCPMMPPEQRERFRF